MTQHFIITDENGMPTGSMDLDKIESQQAILAYEMAANCANAGALEAILQTHIQQAGTEGIGYVLVRAIKTLANDILDPALQVTDGVGIDLRSKLTEITERVKTELGGN